MNSDEQFEVRVPTFRRPDLLRRALRSLVSQEHENWQAIVLDDSPNQEGLVAVNDIDDKRVHYRCNPTNLGLVRNLAKAFRSEPYFDCSTYACVLEDDNYYLPNYLMNALRGMDKANVVLQNAQVAQLYADGRELLQERYTMSPIFGDTPRMIEYTERLARLSQTQLIGNLCLTWKLDSRITFEVAEEPYNQLVQEKMRAVCTREVFWYEPHPFAIWTHFPDATTQERSRWCQRIHNWRWRRSEIEVERFRQRELNRLQEQNVIPKVENSSSTADPWGRLKKKALLFSIPRQRFPIPSDSEISCG